MSTEITTTAAGGHAIGDWAEFFTAALAEVPLVVILRRVSPDEAVRAARTAWSAGVRLVEVTVESDDGVRTLEAVSRAAPEGFPVGAGTVTTPELLQSAVTAGARFAVAPGLDTDTVQAAERIGVPFLPGVATPTEAGHALRLGLTTVKAFPATTLGAAWVSALAGPFPALRVVPTGGITADNAVAFLRAGAVGVGVGQSITTGDGLEELVRATQQG